MIQPFDLSEKDWQQITTAVALAEEGFRPAVMLYGQQWAGLLALRPMLEIDQAAAETRAAELAAEYRARDSKVLMANEVVRTVISTHEEALAMEVRAVRHHLMALATWQRVLTLLDPKEATDANR